MDHPRRLARFRQMMDADGLDGYWLAEAANVRYLCGFSGHDSTLVVAAERCVLLTDSRYAEQAEREACVDQVVSRRGSMAGALGDVCKDAGLKRLGVTAGNLSHAHYEAAASACEPTALVDRPKGIAEQLRLCKDADEVAAIRAALDVAQAAFLALLGELEPGRSENWLAARLEYEMRVRGAEGAAFETICAVGARASMPHAVSGDARVGADSPVLIDWGARLDGYCCDLTRVVGTGTIPRDLRGLVDIVLDAQAAVFERLRPGTRCGDADAAGRAVIAGAGYGCRFAHGVGHGVGLLVHEGPRLGSGCDTVLQPGMVVTVEPGIYVPGEAGVRIEEMALITPEGHQRLSSLPRRPEDLADRGG